LICKQDSAWALLNIFTLRRTLIIERAALSRFSVSRLVSLHPQTGKCEQGAETEELLSSMRIHLETLSTHDSQRWAPCAVFNRLNYLCLYINEELRTEGSRLKRSPQGTNRSLSIALGRRAECQLTFGSKGSDSRLGRSAIRGLVRFERNVLFLSCFSQVFFFPFMK